MTDLELRPVLPLDTRRCCDCGRWFAFERGWLHCCTCPYCAQRELDRARERRGELERSIRALRGAITRLQRGGRA